MSTNRPNKNTNKEYKQTSVDRSVIDDFNARIKKNPDDASAYLNRGLVYHTLGSYDQAIEDFNKAIQLMPDLNTHVKPLLEEAIQKNHNDLKKIPDTVLVPTQSSLLDLKETSKLSRVTKRHHELFKPAVALKKLLRLVVRYELDEKKIKAAQASGVNPILQEVDAFLTQDPTLALKRDHTTDLSGRKRYWSPLEAAEWSGNWVLRNMILEHAKSIPVKEGKISGEIRAEEQLREWKQQAYNYDLTLIRAAPGEAFLPLKNSPTLIKQYSEQGEDKIFQWGDVNGEWQLTELDSDTKKLFAHLNFSDTSSKPPITMPSDQITTDMYDALKKGHTPAHFDLNEYVRVTDAFVRKYPADVPVPQAQWNECDIDSYKIGHTQKKFPAWLAAVWCSTIPFHPLPDVKRLIASPDVCRLKLYYGEDFFDGGLGKDFSIYKAARRRAGGAGRASWRRAGSLIIDLGAMAALCKVITDELGKSKQLLPEEAKSTPGLS